MRAKEIKKRFINQIGCFVAWWILHNCDDGLRVDRKGGAKQIIKVFSEPAYRNIVKPVIHKASEVIRAGDVVTDDGYYGKVVVTGVGRDTFRGYCLADGRAVAGLMAKDFKRIARWGREEKNDAGKYDKRNEACYCETGGGRT